MRVRSCSWHDARAKVPAPQWLRDSSVRSFVEQAPLPVQCMGRPIGQFPGLRVSSCSWHDARAKVPAPRWLRDSSVRSFVEQAPLPVQSRRRPLGSSLACAYALAPGMTRGQRCPRHDGASRCGFSTRGHKKKGASEEAPFRHTNVGGEA